MSASLIFMTFLLLATPTSSLVNHVGSMTSETSPPQTTKKVRSSGSTPLLSLSDANLPPPSPMYHPSPVYYPYKESASYKLHYLEEDEDEEGDQLKCMPLKGKSLSPSQVVHKAIQEPG